MKATQSVFQMVIRPSQCAFVLGLPVSRQDFDASRATTEERYAKRFWHYWPEYSEEFVNDYTALRQLMSDLDVNVIENASLGDFRNVWSLSIRAVILFSHWGRDAIEFRDGFANVDLVAGSIPLNFVGTLDLTVCHPQGLVRRLADTHRSLITKSIWKEASPQFWCMFYRALFQLLQTRSLSYPDAIDETANAFLDRISSREVNRHGKSSKNH